MFLPQKVTLRLALLQELFFVTTLISSLTFFTLEMFLNLYLVMFFESLPSINLFRYKAVGIESYCMFFLIDQIFL